MDTDAASANLDSATSDSLHLSGAAAAVSSALFVGLLAAFTGELAILWPLFLVPVVIAALVYEVPGALVAGAVGVAATALLYPSAVSPAPPLAGMAAGFAAFLACGVAVGLQSSRSRRHSRELEAASVIDPETGLLRSGAFNARLAEEVSRGLRHDVDVSLVLTRVVDLAGLRDTFGAYKTGLLLEHMAQVLRIAVRGTDVIGRVAADAFGVIAPFAGPQEAEIIAGRIRDSIASAGFEGDVLQPVIHCSVAVAHASTPREAAGLDALVGLVEQRLSGEDPAATPGTGGAPRQRPALAGEARA